MRLIRLNKFISDSGYTARRKADILISEGRVTVNGKTISELGTKLNPEEDIVKIDGELIKSMSKLPASAESGYIPKPNYIYILLNKPAGYVTTTSDEKNRPTVMDLIKIKKRIYSVGRLDYDSEGLLLFTNDGDLANKLMHPSHEIEKKYLIKLNRPLDLKSENRLKNGIKPLLSSPKGREKNLWTNRTSPAKVEIVPNTERKQVKITIHEGRNRQVRKMFEAVGLFVRKLKRIEYGNLDLNGLKSGQWRYLNSEEVRKLKSLISK